MTVDAIQIIVMIVMVMMMMIMMMIMYDGDVCCVLNQASR